MTLVYLILCSAAFYAAFCRLVLTDRVTSGTARVAFWLVGVVSSFSIFNTLVWGHVPTTSETLTQLAFTTMLLVSSKRWKNGVPDEYQTRPADSL